MRKIYYNPVLGFLATIVCYSLVVDFSVIDREEEIKEGYRMPVEESKRIEERLREEGYVEVE